MWSGVWGWGINLHYLHSVKIDVPSLIKYPGRTSPHHVAHHYTTYRLATVLTGLFCASITLFWLFTWRVPERVISYDFLPLTYLVAQVAVFLFPFHNLPTAGRRRFLSTFRRIAIGGIAQAQDGKFGDILLADVLTSYAKVLGDLYVTICMFFQTDGSSTKHPDRNCGGVVIVPMLLAIPSVIRFRQCIIEYLRVRRAPYRESTGWGGQHLANALKYSTAFPVIIISSLQRSADTEAKAALNKAWLCAVLINSLYSFWWDVTKDWDLTLLCSKRERTSPNHPFGLRERLIFRPINIYYAVIALDLMLRCTWSMKLSPHLDKFSDFEGGIFLIEFLEVLRRWVWIFFRTEAEWFRHNHPIGLGLGFDDILLGNHQPKYNDDDDE